MIFKILSLMIIVPSVLLAQGFSISKFTTTDFHEGNSFIQGEFSKELAKVKPADISNNNWSLRQKYEDPFEDARYYQLFSGKATNKASSLSSFALPEGSSYSNSVRLKFYNAADAESDDDLESVYFDGKLIYVEDESSLYMQQSGSLVALTPTSNPFASKSAPAVVAAPVETEEPAEETSIAEESEYQVDQSLDDEYATDAATDDITNRFGYGDDIKNGIGWGLVAIGAGLATVAVLEVIKAQDFQKSADSYSSASREEFGDTYDDITNPKDKKDQALAAFDARKKVQSDLASDAYVNSALWGTGALAAWGGSLFLIRF